MVPTAAVIDDSSISRLIIKAALTKAGCRVVAEAASGDRVLELYEQHRPTLMTLDIILPQLDGVTAATQLLRKHPEATVVMCSSLTARDKVLACRDAGVSHFILKPFTPDKVASVVKSVLERVGASAAAGKAP